MWFATNGYVCLIIDTLQLGEIAGKHHGTYNLGRWWWQAAGYTPAGVECWNGIRAIDYLVSRPDVDAERIGVTGISGGGAATIWIAAADDRVKCAVPVSGMSDLESYVSHKVINGHCDCMFLYNTYRWEWTTIAALIAPRPLLFANSDNDSLFPMDGNRRIIDRLRQAYKLYDKPDLVDDYVSKGGHDYRPDLRVAIFQWINKHLKNDTRPGQGRRVRAASGQGAARLPGGQGHSRRTRSTARSTRRSWRERRSTLPKEGDFAEWKKGLMKGLRERPFRAFPDRIPAATRGQAVDSPPGVLLRTEGPIDVLLTDPVQSGKADAKTGLFIVLNSDESALNTVPEWAKPYAGDGPVRLLAPRGSAAYLPWTRKSPPNYIERSLPLLGRTEDEGKVWDVAAACRRLAEDDKEQRAMEGDRPRTSRGDRRLRRAVRAERP